MKSKVRLLLTYLLLALFMLIPAQDVSAQDEPVTIMIGSATVPSGGTAEVPMTLDPGTQLVGAITLDIVYDENILGVVNCRSIEDDENGFSACNTAEPGIIKFTVISVGGISADLRLATIEFQAVGGADVVTDVVIDSVRTLADPFFGDPIVNYTTIDGQIVVDSSALNDASAQIGSAIVEAGQTFEVPLTLDPDGEAVSVVNIDMNYDADLLAVVGCEFDESNESIIGSCYDDLSGLLSFNNAASQDAVTISTPTTLATITFKSIGFVDATTVLDIYRVETLSSFGSVLNYVDGRIVVNGEDPPDGECDGLLCEAEAGQITSEFSRFDDETASGGRYIAATGERTGDWSRPDENARVDYFVMVPEDGIYRIRVTSRERDSTYDSFFVKVDGSPAAHGYRWDVPQGSDSYATNDVSDVNGMDPVEVVLTAGRHKVTFYLRTQGSSLDKFELVKVAPLFDCSGLEREAEAGSLIRGFTVGLDDVASGGAYIHVPYANASTEPDSRNKAEYCFTVGEAGVYRIKGWVHSADEGSNSFFVRMNGIPIQRTCGVRR